MPESERGDFGGEAPAVQAFAANDESTKNAREETVAAFETIEPASEYKLVSPEAGSAPPDVPVQAPVGAEGVTPETGGSDSGPGTFSAPVSAWWAASGSEMRKSDEPTEPQADVHTPAATREPETVRRFDPIEPPMTSAARGEAAAGPDPTIAALDLEIVLANAGLELVQTDAQKQARAASQAEAEAGERSGRRPRERKPRPPASAEPLQMVETTRR